MPEKKKESVMGVMLRYGADWSDLDQKTKDKLIRELIKSIYKPEEEDQVKLMVETTKGGYY